MGRYRAGTCSQDSGLQSQKLASTVAGPDLVVSPFFSHREPLLAEITSLSCVTYCCLVFTDPLGWAARQLMIALTIYIYIYIYRYTHITRTVDIVDINIYIYTDCISIRAWPKPQWPESHFNCPQALADEVSQQPGNI